MKLHRASATTALDYRDSNTQILKRVMVPYYFLGSISIFLPTALLTNVYSVRIISEIFFNLIPTFKNLPAATDFPGAARLFLTVMWLTLPIPFAFVFRHWSFHPAILKIKRNDQWFAIASLLFVAMLFMAPITFFQK